MKYKKDIGYRGTLPYSNVTVDCRYNDKLDILEFTLLHNSLDEGTNKLEMYLTRKMRDQLIDCLNVEYEHPK